MKISATIGNDELDIELIPPENPNEQWKGKKLGDVDDKVYLSFFFENSIISGLVVSEDILNQPGVILERLITVFSNSIETRQMGFEDTENEGLTEELRPYDPEDIRVRPMVLSAFQIHRDIEKNKIDLNPDFQRNFVWGDRQKSLLIESMLLKIPLPAFYFAEDKLGKYQVVDGLQRLTVINSFFNNEFKLKDLEYLTHLEGKYFSEDLSKGITQKDALDDPYDGRVESTQLNINVIEATSPLRVKYDIFYRINTGGRPLNRQEIRNCFANEKSRRLLQKMAANPDFLKATYGSVNDVRMDAQELALRFLGFHLYLPEYTGEMSTFLDMVLDKLNDLSDARLEEAESDYYKSLRIANRLFGKYSFRKCLPEHLDNGAKKQLLNKAMFLVWTTILANRRESDFVDFHEGFLALVLAEKLLNDHRLYSALTSSTTDRGNLDYVFTQFENLLNDNL